MAAVGIGGCQATEGDSTVNCLAAFILRLNVLWSRAVVALSDHLQHPSNQPNTRTHRDGGREGEIEAATEGEIKRHRVSNDVSTS